MVKKNIPMDILSVIIYIWIFCFVILVSIVIHTIINFIIDVTVIFAPLRNAVLGYRSPIMIWFNIIYDYIIRSSLGIVILWSLFSYISLAIIILFLIWVALKDIFLIGMLVKGPPFSTLKGIFNIMLEKIPSKQRSQFESYMQKYALILVHFLKIDKIAPSINQKQETIADSVNEKMETFAVQNIIEKPHFSDEYYDDIGDEYKMRIKNNYFINAFKYNKQNEMAKNYKTMKIITPDNSYVFIENTSSYFSIKTETNLNKMNIK